MLNGWTTTELMQVGWEVLNEHTLVDKSTWKVTAKGMIEAFGFGVGLKAALTVAEHGNVRVLPKITNGPRETQIWNIKEKSDGWYTMDINGAYLTCHDEGYLTVQDLRPDHSLQGIYKVSHRRLGKTWDPEDKNKVLEFLPCKYWKRHFWQPHFSKWLTKLAISPDYEMLCLALPAFKVKFL